ncbi:MAG TPA: hypothetical protein VND64_19495 [Pirellulales bacterium]|nr:hypothetical protein [Pirellulales bacterium]
MPLDLKELSPSIKLGDKIVHVGVLTWGGFKAVLNKFTAADLPLPKLPVDKIGEAFSQIQAFYAAATGTNDSSAAYVASQQANARLFELLAVLVGENLETLKSWLLAHAPIVSALAQEASNLSAEEVDRLSAGQLLRVARAAWTALVADGFFGETAGFFGDLVGLRPKDPSTSSAPPSAAPAIGPDPPSGST